MANSSIKTQVVSVRLPAEIVEILNRRVDKDWCSLSQYLRDLITYQVTRNHHKRKA